MGGPLLDAEPIQQLPGRSQVGSVEALSEPGVNGFEASATLLGVALPQAKSPEARCARSSHDSAPWLRAQLSDCCKSSSAHDFDSGASVPSSISAFMRSNSAMHHLSSLRALAASASFRTSMPC